MTLADRRFDIAVVGMACRFPGGADSPARLWDILADGRDAVTEIDETRWSKDYFYHPDPRQPGRAYTWAAGVVDHVDRFDADFFGISPREAAQMDPQQRILLELVWEALEDGGQVPESIAGSDCGVFVGVSTADYANSRLDDPASGDAYTISGSALSITANRISYVFDLRGPSLAIDTACSSSLVALHQACESLRRGESESAIAGGINLLLMPFGFVGFSKAAMLSPHGRCCAFGAGADGYARSEGGGALFLKPLDQAQRDGDPIHAVIVASGINGDGRTNGLSLPNSAAQERLLRRVYGEADLDPDAVAYVEAHGTGTAAGDLREAGAIGRALGTRRRSGRPLPMGSVKTNLGHLEAASGMAGVIKSILMLERGQVPASLHAAEPNPEIPFAALNLQVPGTLGPLDLGGSRPLIGVNSFGFGGANAHVVLQRATTDAAPEPAPTPPAAPPVAAEAVSDRRTPLMLSARSEGALRDLARSHADLLRDPGGPAPYALACAAALRQQHAQRLVVWGNNTDEIVSGLDRFARGDGAGAPCLIDERTVGRDVPVALLFSGNGSQWPGMGRELLCADPVFAEAVAQVDAAFQPLAGFSLMQTLTDEEDAARLSLTEIAQPLLFAIQVGLVTAMRARGLRPAVVLGHSVGELAAAWAAGVFTLEGATRLIYHRSRVLARTRGAGHMAAVGLPAAELSPLLERFQGAVEIAAYNSPQSVTVSGPLAALEALGEELERRNRLYHILDLEYPFHSRAMDPVRDDLIASLGELHPRPCIIPMLSTVTGERVQGGQLDAQHWWNNVRRPVRLDRAIAGLLAESPHVVIEIGPHPVMQGYVNESIRAAQGRGGVLRSMRRDDAGLNAVDAAVFRAHALGARLDAESIFPLPAPRVSLPPYPWQRERHWFESSGETTSLLGPRYEHPLLGYRLPHRDLEWESQIDTSRLPYLADHVVGGAVVMPASGFMEMALAAGETLNPTGPRGVEHFEIRAPLVLSLQDTKVVQFRVLGDDHRFEIRSRPRLGDGAWATHVVGRLSAPSLRTSSVGAAPPQLDVDAAWAAEAETVSAEQHYQRAAEMGLHYGPAFRGLSVLRSRDPGHIARIAVPEAIATALGPYQIHPSLLDACLQGLFNLPSTDGDLHHPEMVFLPASCREIIFHGSGDRIRIAFGAVTRRSPRSILADFTLYDADGGLIAELRGFRFHKVRLGHGSAQSAMLY